MPGDVHYWEWGSGRSGEGNQHFKTENWETSSGEEILLRNSQNTFCLLILP